MLSIKFKVHTTGPLGTEPVDAARWTGSVDFGEGVQPLKVLRLRHFGTDANGRGVYEIELQSYPFTKRTLPKSITVSAFPPGDRFDLAAPLTFTQSGFVNVLRVQSIGYDPDTGIAQVEFQGSTDFTKNDIENGLVLKYDVINRRLNQISRTVTANNPYITFTESLGVFSATFNIPIESTKTDEAVFVWAEVTPIAERPTVTSLGTNLTIDCRWLKITSVSRDSTQPIGGTRFIVNYATNLFPKSAREGSVKARLKLTPRPEWTECTFVSNVDERSDKWTCGLTLPQGTEKEFMITLDGVSSPVYTTTA